MANPGEAQVHVVSVGTSILTNARRDVADAPWPLPPSPAAYRERMATLGPVLSAYVQRDPWRASAELNAMRGFLEDHVSGRQRIAYVHLVLTDTVEARLCADALQACLQGYGIAQITQDTLPAQAVLRARDDDPEPSLEFVDGLAELRDHLLDFVRRRQQEGYDVLLNATGGLKPETAVLVLVGGLLEVPVYYIHEAFRQAVLLPPLCLPHDRARQLASYLARFPEDRRLAGPDARRLWEDLRAAGLWAAAVHLRIVRPGFPDGEGDAAPHVVELTAIGRYVLRAWAADAGRGSTPS